jgi:hypothetical protein
MPSCAYVGTQKGNIKVNSCLAFLDLMLVVCYLDMASFRSVPVTRAAAPSYVLCR